MILNLSESEAEILRQILTRFLEQTKEEIHHTDTRSFKDMLKGEEAAVASLLQKLAAK
ncbi:MAG: hypothetical protein HYX73_06140 [Acidobacteria bacterium]|nr:hypothetical protein [Acidobacteriota bacterium]